MPERGSKTWTVPGVWANFGIFSARSKWFSDAIGDHGRNLVISLWLETKQQPMEFRHCCSLHPKNFQVQKSAGKVSACLDFLGSRRHSRHWLTSEGPNYQRRVLPISAGAIEGHFEGKTPREVHQVGLVLARKCPRSPGTCNPEETVLPGLPVSWSSTQFSVSGPVGLPPLPWTEKKNNWISPFFVPSFASAETMLDGQISDFIWVACRS